MSFRSRLMEIIVRIVVGFLVDVHSRCRLQMRQAGYGLGQRDAHLCSSGCRLEFHIAAALCVLWKYT